MNSITPLEFWSAIFVVLIPQIFQVIKDFRTAQINKGVREAQQENIMSEAWERLSQEYARQIESLRKLEVENSELRPLVLKLALQEKDMEQIKQDKEDWKRYANKLAKQIEDLGQIPIPFRRLPQEGDTLEKMKAITPDQIKRSVEDTVQLPRQQSDDRGLSGK